MSGFPGGSVLKNPPANAGDVGDWVEPWVGKIPWRRRWQLPLVLLPGKFHRQGSLAGYSPWGHKQLDPTEHAHTQSKKGLLFL